jgi:site-specific DNA-cytosine methylase
MKRSREPNRAADLERLRAYNSKKLCKAASKREYKASFAEKHAVSGKLANVVRAGGRNALDAWLQLRPILFESTKSANHGRAARAHALIGELSSAVQAAGGTTATLSITDTTSDPLSLLSLFDGWGGGVAAFAAALKMSAAAHGTPLRDAVCVHAGDNDSKHRKTVMAAAVAPLLSPVRFTEKEAHQPADITDKAFYNTCRIRHWGRIHVAVCGFPCIYHSPASCKTRTAPFGFSNPACVALAEAFLDVISVALPGALIVECSDRLCSDPLYETVFLARLKDIGYHVYLDGHYVLKASSWVCVERVRTYIVAFRDRDACCRFTGAAPPQKRESRVASAILDPCDERLPHSVWDRAKSARSKISSQAAQAVQRQKLGEVGVFDHKDFRTKKKRRRMPGSGVIVKGYQHGVLNTLIRSSSRVYRVNTCRGTRTLCALECGRLLGVPDVFVEAMLRVASDSQVTSALGDGFALPVARDVLLAVMRACLLGV